MRSCEPSRQEDLRAIEWWHWFQVFSFEAPLVAVLWTHLIARSLGTAVSTASLAWLGLSAWIIYMGDRWLDAHAQIAPHAPSHQFYRRHSRFLAAVIGTALLALVILCWKELDAKILELEVPVAAGTVLYLLRVHLRPFRRRSLWPREFAVGILFAAAVCVPAWAQSANTRRVALDFFVFAALVILNATAIKVWAMAPIARHTTTRWTGRRITLLGGVLAGLLFTFNGDPNRRPVLYAAMASALVLAVLPVIGRSWRRRLWGAAADAALLTPLLLPVFWR